MHASRQQAGDTIIEVIMAFAVFSMLAVGSLMLMNHGTESAQQALESTLTQQVVSGQVESIRYLRESYLADQSASGPAAIYKDIITNKTVTAPSAYGDTSCVTSSAPSNAFAVNPSTAKLTATPEPISAPGAPVYPQVVTATNKAYGVWVQAVRPTGSPTPNFVDFHVRACWYSPMGSNVSTTGTIVRLYSPL